MSRNRTVVDRALIKSRMSKMQRFLLGNTKGYMSQYNFFMCSYDETFLIYIKDVHFSFAVLLGVFGETFVQ